MHKFKGALVVLAGLVVTGTPAAATATPMEWFCEAFLGNLVHRHDLMPQCDGSNVQVDMRVVSLTPGMVDQLDKLCRPGVQAGKPTVVKDAEMVRLLTAAQADRRTNVMTMPRMTLFSGQEAELQIDGGPGPMVQMKVRPQTVSDGREVALTMTGNLRLDVNFAPCTFATSTTVPAGRTLVLRTIPGGAANGNDGSLLLLVTPRPVYPDR